MKILAARKRDFLYWAMEREAIRLRRETGEKPPWTRDRILNTYRFCNVRRRDDRVSRWIEERVINGAHASGNGNGSTLWIELALARYVNWPDSINMLMEQHLWPDRPHPDWTAIGAALDHRVQAGYQTWTGAYMVRAESNPEASWYNWGKGRYVAEIVVGALWEERRLIEPNLRFTVQRAHETLAGYYGWGSFMAGQVVADLTYTPYLAKAPDLYTWAPLGPGSARGINRLTGRELRAPLKQADALPIMLELREELIARHAPFADLTLHDVQNICCEVSKWWRVKFGEGRPRSLYRPLIIGGKNER